MESEEDVNTLEEEPSEGALEGKAEGEANAEGEGNDTVPADQVEASAGLSAEAPEPIQTDPPDDRVLPAPNVETIMEIEIPVTVSFGSTTRPLREILHLAPGSRLELNYKAEQPVVLTVNNKPFARGQVVVVDGCYGVKIEEIETTEKRIASLGE